MHDLLEDTQTTSQEIAQGWGADVLFLVEGITKVERATEIDRRRETYKKMLLAASDDARVLVIKLADRLHNLRTISALSPERRRRMAEETLDVYAPIAHRLGLQKIKTELEDRSLAIIDPQSYEEAGILQKERRAAGSDEMQRLQAQLRRALQKEGLRPVSIKSRVKSRFSIAEKMRRRERSDIWDILGMRLIVEKDIDCYLALGVVHKLWKPLPEQFDDYIALPRENLYQSLHTTVMAGNKPLEVQIRTPEMNELAEHGIAAHWSYKEDARAPSGIKRSLSSAARSALKSKDLDELFSSLREDVFARDIYLWTPKGEIRILPEGATAIDFAYSIHTEVGHRTVGARVNGKMYPIKKPLPQGSQVEIITRQGSTPSPDWLESVRTTKAGNRIRAKISQSQTRGKEEEGIERIKRSLEHQGMSVLSQDITESLEQAGYSDLEEVGRLALRDRSALRNIVRDIIQKSGISPQESTRQRARLTDSQYPVSVAGMDDVLLRLAGCCSPKPPDQLLGYISLGRGVSIHRKDCPEIEKWRTQTPERLVPASWQRDPELPVIEVQINFLPEKTPVSDLARVLQDNRDILSLQIDALGEIARALARVALSAEEDIEILSQEVQDLPGVIEFKQS